MAPITIHGPKEGFMLYLVPLGKEAAFCGCSNTWLAVDQQLRMAEVIVISYWHERARKRRRSLQIMRKRVKISPCMDFRKGSGINSPYLWQDDHQRWEELVQPSGIPSKRHTALEPCSRAVETFMWWWWHTVDFSLESAQLSFQSVI